MRADNRMTDFLSRVAIFVIVLICLVGVFGWYLPLIKENQSLRREIADQETTLARLKHEIRGTNQKLTSYESDPRSAERLARENLGYSKPGETVFRFEQ
jgi:cell division protein FtsB